MFNFERITVSVNFDKYTTPREKNQGPSDETNEDDSTVGQIRGFSAPSLRNAHGLEEA